MIIRLKAFTVIELLTVIFIISLLIASFTPSATRMYQESRLNRRASEVAAFLREARQLAVTEQTIYGIAIYLNQNKFELIHRLVNQSPPPEYEDEVNSIFFVEAPLEISSSSLADGELLTFNSVGNPSKSADILLTDIYNKSRLICINAAGSIEVTVNDECN